MMSDFCISTARLASLVIEKRFRENIDHIEGFFKSLTAAAVAALFVVVAVALLLLLLLENE